MDDSETFMLVLCLIIAAWVWLRWYRITLLAGAFVPFTDRLPVLIAPLVGVFALWLVLANLSSFDVRDSAIYILFYLLIGLAWLGVALLFLPFGGLSVRDDAIERRNHAASFAVGGALLGIMFCYAGGNIGNGPGWWVVIISAGLATVALFVLWFVLQWLTSVSDSVTVGRDVASGLRLAGFLVAAGLVLGRAVAGDWQSLAATIIDFVRFGWPVLGLTVIAVLFETLLRPSIRTPFGSPLLGGALPALIYIALAAGVLYIEPLATVMPR